MKETILGLNKLTKKGPVHSAEKRLTCEENTHSSLSKSLPNTHSINQETSFFLTDIA